MYVPDYDFIYDRFMKIADSDLEELKKLSDHNKEIEEEYNNQKSETST